jgi:alkanesulfonate monooxygenase SsuD/methylene tetrahydromethanopterin reductase-like flavin-dependent oxidoreductase (luciferase family)
VVRRDIDSVSVASTPYSYYMRMAIWISSRQPWHEIDDIAQHADTTGWDRLYVSDHFMGDRGPKERTPTLEATALVCAIAQRTSRIGIGPLVLGNTYRHPAVVANWAATTDHLSGGRLILGLGASWQANEHDQYGIVLPPPAERLKRLEEACQVVRSLLEDNEVTFDGQTYRLLGAICEPKPVQARVPLLVGGSGDRLLGIVARRADEWNCWASPDHLRNRRSVLVEACNRVGRDPAGVACSVQAYTMLTDDRRRARAFMIALRGRARWAGSAEEYPDAIDAWASAGATEIVVPDLFLGTGTARRDVMDALLEASRIHEAGLTPLAKSPAVQQAPPEVAH